MQPLTSDRQAAGREAVQPAAAAADGAATAVAELEARVAALHREAQRLNKIPGQEAAAAAVYKQLAALDDQALHLQLQHAPPLDPGRTAAHAAAHPCYCRLLAPAPAWADAAAAAGAHCSAAQLRRRSLHAVLGYALGDAAACSCQWVYSEAALQTLAQGRRTNFEQEAEGRLPPAKAQAKRQRRASPLARLLPQPLRSYHNHYVLPVVDDAGRAGLEFHDPPQCPFFDYPLGSSSPYGEQTVALADSLVKAGGLDCCRYATDLFAAFGPGFEGYRDRSTKSFLRRYAAGALPPHTGSADDQANAFIRLPPLVALYAGAGRGHLLAAVECMIRVTQNDPVAVAYGCAAALVLEAVLLGSSVAAAVAATVEWLRQQAGMVEGPLAEAAGQPPQTARAVHTASDELPAALQVGALSEPAVQPSLWAEVADRLVQAAELAPLPPLEAATRLGRNCHLPNSLQTPLQVLLHMEFRFQQAGGVQQLDAATNSSGPPAAAAAANSNGPPAAAAAALAEGAAAGDDTCLPCSMGAAACPLPARRAGQRAAAGSPLLQALVQQQGGGSRPASLPPEAYVEAVRSAIRPGGCCASRAGFAGALAGALVAGGGGGSGGASGVALPRDWMQCMRGWDAAAEIAEQLVALRD